MNKYLCRIVDDPDTDMEIEAAYHWEAAELFLEKYNEFDPPSDGDSVRVEVTALEGNDTDTRKTFAVTASWSVHYNAYEETPNEMA